MSRGIDVDPDDVRDALEEAWIRKKEQNPNKLELYAYAELPPETPDDMGITLADEVVSNPPQPEKSTDRPIPADIRPREADEDDSHPRDEAVETPLADHYDRVEHVYSELGQLENGHLCLGNHDFIGWYRERGLPGEHYDGEARPWVLAKEFDGIRNELDRVVYSTINFAPSDWFIDAFRGYHWTENGRQWADGEKPTPGYGEITAYAPFADIDLEDDVKTRRPDGDIPRDRVETALQMYVDRFAELAGSREHVFVLDSVGGAYVMIAPMSTAPIAEQYSPDARRRLFEDLTDRMNDWLDDARSEVNSAVDIGDIFEPDLLNNKNRLYKAPMSVHSSLDGIVTPIDPADVNYEYTALGSVSDSDIAATSDWAADFTADHSDALTAIVTTLWPSYADGTDGWKEALDARLKDLEADAKQHQEQEERLSDVEVPDDLERTDDVDVIRKSLENIDVKKLARKVADEWDTAPGRDPPRFDPSWRTSDSGTSCYADSEKFVDLQEGKKGGGALKLIARDRRIITDCRKSLEKDDYWKAIAELRKKGYEIPRFTGGRGTHPDALGLYDEANGDDEKRKKALRALKASKKK